MRIVSLPARDLNIFLYVKRAHMQMLLWTTAGQLGPPVVSVSEYGWKIKDGITCLSIGTTASN